MLTTHRGIQVLQIPEALCWRPWCLALTSVFSTGIHQQDCQPTDLIITNVYIPPASSCTGGYNPSLDHLMMTTDTFILGDFNAHHSSWYSSSTDSRGTMLETMVSGSNFGILNWDSPTRLPTQFPLMSH